MPVPRAGGPLNYFCRKMVIHLYFRWLDENSTDSTDPFKSPGGINHRATTVLCSAQLPNNEYPKKRNAQPLLLKKQLAIYPSWFSSNVYP